MTEVGIFYQLLKPTSLRRCGTVSPVNPWNPISWKKQGHYSFANAINVLTKPTRNTTEQFTVNPSILDHWFDKLSYTPMGCQQASNSYRTTSHRSCRRTSLLPWVCQRIAPQGEVEKLDKLVCRCGHLNYLEPMEFSRLVRITLENCLVVIGWTIHE